jgi:Fe-S oxidoreductase
MILAYLGSPDVNYFEKNLVFHIIFIILFIAVAVSFCYDILYRFNQVFHGQKADRSGRYLCRIKSFFVNVIFQKKLFKHPFRGIFHVLVFWGFIYYSIHTINQVVAGVFKWSIPDPYLYHLFNMEQAGSIGALYNRGLDYISLLVLIGLICFAVRRWIFKAKELDRPSGQSALIIGLIALLMVSTLLLNAAVLVIDYHHYNHSVSLIGKTLSGIFHSETIPTDEEIAFAKTSHTVLWWIHILAVFAFMIVVPRSKHSHLIFAPFNYFWYKTTSKGKLDHMDLEDENLESWGAANIKEFPWPSLLDSLSCIECGRCTLHCPANITGKKLNPKTIMTHLKESLIEKMPGVMAKKEESSRVIDDYISTQEIWACTSCYSCVDQCPVGNNQLDAIYEMRRALVLSESNFPDELKTAFTNMENNSNPWGVGAHLRCEWMEGLDVKIMNKIENPDEIEYLFWVGCAGAFDDRNKKISRAIVNIFNKAGLSFAVLGEEEMCNGDSARRAGNEYLFQTLAASNVEILNKYKIKKIVTACPHCFNTLKNEYTDFGGQYEVFHHSQIINQLISNGKIELNPSKELGKVVFHDSCYLGRYNDIYNSPRNIIKSAAGESPKEIRRAKSNGMCCGAGGAQMWMEELEGTRVNFERTNQLLEPNPKTLVTSCPFCITMVTDGVKEKNKTDDTQVLDIAEIAEKTMK